MQEILIWSYKQIVFAQPWIHPGKWDAQNSLGFSDTNGSSSLGQTTRPSDCQQKKTRTCWIVDFTVPVDLKVKLKKAKRDINTWTLLENRKTMEHESNGDTGMLSTIPKRLVQGVEGLEIRGPVETIQTTALLRSARILSWRLEETCCPWNSSGKQSANAGSKNSPKRIIIIIIIIIIIRRLICTNQNLSLKIRRIKFS